MSKILILGASGFIGKTLSLRLAKENEIIAFSNKISDETLGIKNIANVEGNFSGMVNFIDLLDGVDSVIHLISTTVPNDDTSHIPEEIEQNVIPTVRLMEDMVKCDVKKIIFASSAGTIYGETGNKINDATSSPNPLCGYGVQKAVIEAYLKFYGLRYGLDYRIMRISNPYGTGQDSKKMQGLIPIFVERLIHNESISVFGKGDNMRDYIFISDLINGIVKVMDYAGKQRIFNLGYGKYYSVLDVIRLIEQIGERKFSSVNVIDSRFCDVHESYVDMEQSHMELNWFPKVGIEDGILLTLKAML